MAIFHDNFYEETNDLVAKHVDIAPMDVAMHNKQVQ